MLQLGDDILKNQSEMTEKLKAISELVFEGIEIFEQDFIADQI